VSGLADIAKIARERRHTLLFLARLRRVPPVFLDTEIDMTRVLEHRETGRRYSIVTYVLYAAGRALAKHPEANAAIEGGLSPKVARYAPVNGKLTLDRTLNGHRVEALRDGDPHALPDFAGARLLHRLPAAVGWAAYELAARALDKRPDTTGTFSVTSLGHRPVDGFHSLGGTTVTLGVGRILDRPVVRDGAVAVAPVMRLNLSFDHRVIDGAEAADLLADVKDGLENF
jgi:pyruvate/2-oxoglutarate dehydrogenase complex dihydrolipoamide acyltransferase (E2) component